MSKQTKDSLMAAACYISLILEPSVIIMMFLAYFLVLFSSILSYDMVGLFNSVNPKTAKHKRAVTTKLSIDIPECITKHQVFRLYVSNDADYPGVAIYPYKKPGWFIKGWVETNPHMGYEEGDKLNKVDVDYSLANLAKRELAWNTLEFTSAFHVQGNLTFPLKLFIPELVNRTYLNIMFKTGPWACSQPYSEVMKIAPTLFPTIFVSGTIAQSHGLILLLATYIVLMQQ